MAVEENQAPQEQPETTTPTEEYGPPRGAFAFVILMMTMYTIYWIITYFEVFILRGNY